VFERGRDSGISLRGDARFWNHASAAGVTVDPVRSEIAYWVCSW
jgi:hypothetical protein